MHRRGSGSSLGRTVPGKVLGFAHDRVVGIQAFALCAAYKGQTEPTREVWILTKVFLHAPPPTIASKIQYRSEKHVHTGRTRLGCDGCSRPLRNIRIPGGGKVDRSRKYRSRVEAVQALLDK